MKKKIAIGVVHTGDRLQSDQQARTREVTQAFNDIPFLRGKLVSVKFPTGGVYQAVRHNLGTRAACFPVRMTYNTNPTQPVEIGENPDQSGVDVKNQLSLAVSVPITLDLWFYPLASKAIDPRTNQSF